jgi:xylulose-5-phosphate/fructose-6-phosphate phosphoketolase
MPGQVIDAPNPPALPSHLPDETLSLAVKIEKKTLGEDAAQSLKDFQRAACYIAGGQPIPPPLAGITRPNNKNNV